jgi:predicted RNA-binding Zn ribbon-like protein
MTFKYVSGRRSLDFAGTLKYRASAREELLTDSQQLSNWAVEAGLVDAAIEIGDDELAAAISLREAIYRIVVARLKGDQLAVADVELLNKYASQPQLTPLLNSSGSVIRAGTAPQLLARLAADLLDLLASSDVEKIKECSDPGCTRLYIDASRAQNRHWCGMGTCGNRAKVQAFRARQHAAAATPRTSRAD